MNVFIRIEADADQSDLPIISDSDIWKFEDADFEPGSLDNWIFGSDDSSLVGARAGTLLMPQNAAPVYESNYMTIGGYQQSLLSQFDDMDGLTICAVVRAQGFDDINNSVIVANSGGGLSGQALAIVGGGPPVTRSIVRGHSPLIRDRAFSISEGLWYFVAQSQGGFAAIPYAGGELNYEMTSVAPKSVSPFKVALGNSYEANPAFNSGFDVAEFILFDRKLSVEELDAVYSRSKARQARRGVAVV